MFLIRSIRKKFHKNFFVVKKKKTFSFKKSTILVGSLKMFTNFWQGNIYNFIKKKKTHKNVFESGNEVLEKSSSFLDQELLKNYQKIYEFLFFFQEIFKISIKKSKSFAYFIKNI